MDSLKKAEQNFLSVRDFLKRTGPERAFRLSFYKPMRFYLENGFDEAVRILKREADDIRFNDWLKKHGGNSEDKKLLREIFDAMDDVDKEEAEDG